MLAVFGVGIEAWVWGWGMILGCLVWEKGGTAEELGFWGDGQVMATFFFCSLSLSPFITQKTGLFWAMTLVAIDFGFCFFGRGRMSCEIIV